MIRCKWPIPKRAKHPAHYARNSEQPQLVLRPENLDILTYLEVSILLNTRLAGLERRDLHAILALADTKRLTPAYRFEDCAHTSCRLWQQNTQNIARNQ